MAKKMGKILECRHCKKPIYVKKYQIAKGKFCSKDCYSRWAKGKPSHKPRLTANCPICKNSWHPVLSNVKRGKDKYCSKKCYGKYKRTFIGEKSFNWKGGKTPKDKNIRNSLEYNLWRKAVYERDNYTCVWCGKRGVKLNADHIKPFSLYPELRFAIDNGRTLCVKCHKTTDTYGSKSKKYENNI